MSLSANIKTEKLRFILVLLFVFMLPFDRFYTSIMLMLIIATSLIDLSLTRLKTIPKQFWIFQMVFFLGCMAYPYSYNKTEASFILERQLSILLFPLVLPLAIDFNLKRLDIILKILSISCLLVVLFLFAHVIYILKSGSLPMKYMLSKEFFNHNFSAPINIHAGYLSLYISLSLLYLVKVLVTRPSASIKITVAVSMVILIAGLFFLASRNTLIATVLIIFFIVPLFLYEKKTKYFIVISIFLGVSFFAFSEINYLNTRFSSGLITDIRMDNKSEYNYEGAEPRIKRWKGALELISKSPLFGYGTGDEITMLKTKYVEHELFVSYLESFNAHNQYLSYALKNGIIGLMIFLAAFIYYVWLSLKNRSYIYFSFLLLLLIGFFTENILDANKGIFFFAFFNTIFGYTLLKEPKNQSV